jgi:hypothetical protein
MDTRDRHVALDYGHLALHIAGVLLVIAVWVVVIWLLVAPVKDKVYESTGETCHWRTVDMTCAPTVPHPQ